MPLIHPRVISAIILLLLLSTICGVVSAALAPRALNQTAPVATATPRAVVCTAPCECLMESEALTKWGSNGYQICAEIPCGYVTYLGTGDVTSRNSQKYCYKQKLLEPQPVSNTLRVTTATTTLLPLAVDTRKTLADSDGDGFVNIHDNCPYAADKDQWDRDSDGAGDICDTCEFTPNVDQEDKDGDGVGDSCDLCPLRKYTGQSIWEEDSDAPGHLDADEDNVGDLCDNCPYSSGLFNAYGSLGPSSAANPDQTDSDSDGVGDICDRCPDANDREDRNSDNIPDCIQGTCILNSTGDPLKDLESYSICQEKAGVNVNFETTDQKQSQIFGILSNISKTLHNTAWGIIHNM